MGWDGLDTAGATRVVGCSARTSAVRLHRARQRLERELADRDEQLERLVQRWDVPAGLKGERA